MFMVLDFRNELAEPCFSFPVQGMNVLGIKWKAKQNKTDEQALTRGAGFIIVGGKVSEWFIKM